jgi:dihydrofolate reductase
VFVIGGAMLYKTLLPYCTEVLVTKVKADGGAEVFFENLDALDNWKCVSVSEPIETNGIIINFTTYKNSTPQDF